MKQTITCIACPLGCRVEIEEKSQGDKKYLISGHKCIRGEKYAIEEITDPTRVLTYTVKIMNANLSRLPVKTAGAITKGLLFSCIEEVDKIELQAPIKIGDVIIENVLNTGIDIVASRSLNAI
ncbi:MAG: DUF1667 domain-containing protein [Alkaliphilus sp.]